MHPQIQQPSQGDCPICGMDLIPLESGQREVPPTQISLTTEAKELARIETSPVVRAFPVHDVRLYGKIGYDETRLKSISARFPARVDRLYADFDGVSVRRGDHLADVYSPDLLSAQRELLAAHRSDPGGRLEQAARTKLRLWDFSETQIQQILQRGEASEHLRIDSPISGTVVLKNIKEGDYVETGDTLFRVADFSKVWVYLEAYESDLPWLRYGQKVRIEAEALPGRSFEGMAAFVSPELDPNSRTARLRVNVENPDGALKPGMFVHARVQARLASAGRVMAPELAGKWISPMHPGIIKDAPGQCDICGMDLVPAEELGYATAGAGSGPPLLVPASAVLLTGRRAVVYLEEPEAPEPTYTGRTIELGPRAGDTYIVEAGLREGERVVTHGAFKIDSALQIEGRPSMMNPASGETAPAGHAAPHADSAGPPQLPGSEGMRAAIDGMLGHYFALQEALAADDLEGARAAAQRLRPALEGAPLASLGSPGQEAYMRETAALTPALEAIAAAESLDSARGKAFETLSSGLERLVRIFGTSGKHDVYLMHCPMVYGTHGADWLQDNPQLANPYWGSQMLRCGETRAQLSSRQNGGSIRN